MSKEKKEKSKEDKKSDLIELSQFLRSFADQQFVNKDLANNRCPFCMRKHDLKVPENEQEYEYVTSKEDVELINTLTCVLEALSRKFSKASY